MDPKRAKRLRRRARAVALEAAKLVPRPERVPFSAPLQDCGVKPDVAAMLLRLDAWFASGRRVPGDLTAPVLVAPLMQQPFRLTMADALELWRHGHPFAVPCPGCGATARIIHFGGGFAVGGGYYVCSTCDRYWLDRTGGWSPWSSAMPAGARAWERVPVSAPADILGKWLAGQGG